jgi:hypothetical protein
MKLFFTTLICLTITLVSQAQEKSSGILVEINAARMLQLLGNDEPTQQINPYVLGLGYHTEKLGFRLGLGLDKNNITHQPAPANGNVTSTRDSSVIDWRLGAYYQLALHERWTLQLGLDFYAANRESSLNTKFTNENGEAVEDQKTNTYKESGISPYFAVHYQAHPRVAIGSELLLRIGSSSNIEKATSNLFPEFDSELVTDGSRAYFMAPSALFVRLTL